MSCPYNRLDAILSYARLTLAIISRYLAVSRKPVRTPYLYQEIRTVREMQAGKKTPTSPSLVMFGNEEITFLKVSCNS